MHPSKSYIVTGASRGIGRAIAEKLIMQGAYVIGLSRNFQWKHPFLRTLSLDMGDLNHMMRALEDLKKEIPSLDGIICCAGRGRFGSLEEFSYKQIKELMDLNFLSHAFLIKTFIPLLKQQEHGDIIFIGSEAAQVGKRQGSIYCATKFAMRGFCQALREECATSNLRISLINPGMVNTSFFEDLSFVCGQSEDEHLIAEDVAEAVFHVLCARKGAVFDEINLSPQKKRMIFKPKF